MKVGIIGMGVVGSAQSRMFAKSEQVTYDPAYDDKYPFYELQKCDFAIIAVGTPSLEDGKCDVSQVFNAFNRLPPLLPVMIRSTIPPGTTNKLTRYRESHTVFVPEFLHEREGGDWKESSDVPFLIMGGSPQSRSYFWPLVKNVYPWRIHGCSAIEAEMLKYTINIWNAAKVTFVNEIAKICSAYGVSYDEVREGWLRDPRMTPQYTESPRHFGAGFGGPCLPKDLSALIEDSKNQGYEPKFLEAIQEANARFKA